MTQYLVRCPISFGLTKKKCDTEGTPNQKWDWHLGELKDILKTSAPNFLERNSIRIFIDALDECGKEMTAVELVEEF